MIAVDSCQVEGAAPSALAGTEPGPPRTLAGTEPGPPKTLAGTEPGPPRTPDLFDYAAREDIYLVEQTLRKRGDWMHASEVLATLEKPVTEGGKRWVREVASQSQVIASGQRGYCHADSCTVPDLQHAAAWMVSQAKRMIKRAIRLKRIAALKLWKGTGK